MLRLAAEGELQGLPLPPGVRDALLHALRTEREIAPHHPDGSAVFLLQPSDTDATVAQALGAPLASLSLDAVRHHPERGVFVAHRVHTNSDCTVLIIPDAVWLPGEWRVRLVGLCEGGPT